MRVGQVVTIGAALMLAAWAAWMLFGPSRPQPEAAATPIPPVAAPAASPRPVRAAPTESQTNSSVSTNTLEKFPDGEPRKLTAEQAEAYVRENHRNAASLLAAARASGDKAYLREAMEKFPNDPRVAFDAYFFTGGPRDNSKPATPERRQWLENFKQSDPNNALPNYLAARDDFRSGQPDQALQELRAASAKPTYQAYLQESLQSAEEAYRTAGFSEADAKSQAAWNLLLPHLSETRQLGENLADLATQYQRAGDNASAQNILQMGLSLGERVEGPEEFPLISTLVGIAIQKKLLGAMDPASPYLDTGMTVQNQLDALDQYRQSLKSIVGPEENILPRMSDADRVNFYDRLRMFGEPAAARWAVEKYGTQ